MQYHKNEPEKHTLLMMNKGFFFQIYIVILLWNYFFCFYEKFPKVNNLDQIIGID